MKKTAASAPVSLKSDPLAIITTGTGFFKPGFTGRITAGGERLVYLGSEGALVPTKLPEFTVVLDGSKYPREFCQYGRDFVFANKAA